MKRFLSQFASTSCTFNNDLLTEAQNMNSNIFQSTDSMLVQTKSDGSVIVTGLRPVVQQKAFEISEFM